MAYSGDRSINNNIRRLKSEREYREQKRRNNPTKKRTNRPATQERTINVRRKKKKSTAGSFDFTLLFVIMLLILFGIVMVFSSSYYYALTNVKFDNNMYYFVERQAIWSIIGLGAMAFFINFPYKYIRNFTFMAYVITIICLIIVLFVGDKINGSRRWLGFGTIGFQPSEVAKIVVILHLSNFISSNKGILGTLKGFIRCALILAVPVVLVGVSNLSTAIVIAGIGVCIMFIASPKVWYFFAAAIPAGALGVVAVSLPQFAYRFDRIKYWRDPFLDPTDKGFQIIQSLFAVASGGFFGLGLGQSRQKTYVPEPYNDIIFAIICEELGMFGAIVVIGLFMTLIWRGIKIAMNSQDMFGCLTATGIVGLIGIQVIINISVATNTMPNTGMALPFISYGGSALVFTLSAMGILLNISKFQKNRE
ncbi:MAG: putative peptidoglycan glycosyltransferase FtsW [Lachnospiraceae bacterium]|nr:putative peptidoglycan glycosyltransferase FtsW [Lachnospiraceae bacterium]